MMSKKLLSEFVKLVLSEAAANPSAAVSAGLALAEHNKMYMLYDPQYYVNKLTQINKEAIENSLEQILRDPGGMKGFVEITNSSLKAPCYGAWMISASAADKGFGPLLYDIAMATSPNHTLIPDRRTVSDSARNIWKFYLERRKDVQKLPLDNFKDPKTPDKNDDCQVYDDWSAEELDYAYRSPNIPQGIQGLFSNHQKFMQQIISSVESVGGEVPDVSELERNLGFAGEDLFRGRLRTDVQSAFYND